MYVVGLLVINLYLSSSISIAAQLDNKIPVKLFCLSCSFVISYLSFSSPCGVKYALNQFRHSISSKYCFDSSTVKDSELHALNQQTAPAEIPHITFPE